jgi:hypothetical protein
MSALEPRGARLVRARLAWAAALIVVAASVAASLGMLADPEWRMPLLRNTVGLAGLALLGAVLLGARLAWLPVFVPGVATLLAGRDPYTAEPHAWALMLAPAGAPVAAAAALAVAVAGVVAYGRWDSRPTRGVTGE